MAMRNSTSLGFQNLPKHRPEPAQGVNFHCRTAWAASRASWGISGNLAETMYRTFFADINVKNERAL